MVKHILTMGRNIGTGANVQEISEFDFSNFLSLYADPLLKAYTVTDAIGTWEGNREKTKVLSVSCNLTEGRTILEKLNMIGQEYCRYFSQECVMIESHELHRFQFVSAEKAEVAA